MPEQPCNGANNASIELAWGLAGSLSLLSWQRKATAPMAFRRQSLALGLQSSTNIERERP